MPTPLSSALAVSILLAGLIALATACAGEPPARLPDHVTAAIVYNEEAERWHAGAIVAGDRPSSSLRVLCLTEAGKPWADSGHEHTGINIEASPGEQQQGESTWSTSISPSEITDPESVWGREWAWQLDGRPWEGGRWSMSTNTRPANLVASNERVESAFFDDLQRAKTAELIGSKDEASDLRITFDLSTLFSTPVQFAIDDCDADVIEQHTGDYHSAYAYWSPDSKRHSITLIERDADTGRALLLSCGPTGWTDDDAPDWIREAKSEVFAAATLLGVSGESDYDHEQAAARAVESATVSWADGNGKEGTTVWDVRYNWLYPPSARENLRFIDALRGSEELIVTVEMPDLEPVELALQGRALFAKPIGPELDACIREYAERNG